MQEIARQVEKRVKEQEESDRKRVRQDSEGRGNVSVPVEPESLPDAEMKSATHVMAIKKPGGGIEDMLEAMIEEDRSAYALTVEKSGLKEPVPEEKPYEWEESTEAGDSIGESYMTEEIPRRTPS